MREYGQIQSSYWNHPDILSRSTEGKLLGAYLMTGPHANGIGCYRLPFGYVEADLQWSPETVAKAFAELSEIGFSLYCEKSQFVFMPNFLKFNPISNGNVAKNREKEFRSVPRNTSFYPQLAQALLDHGNHFKDPFTTLLQTLSQGFDKGFGEGFTKQDPTRPDPKVTSSPIGDEVSTADAADPAVNDESMDGSEKIPPCPHRKIVELYHRILPEAPAIRELDDDLQKNIRARWRTKTANGDPRWTLAWWETFFTYIHESCPFLYGQEHDDRKPPFNPGLRWMVKPRNFAKIVEKHYDSRRRAAA